MLREHWDQVWTTKPPTGVSWYQDVPRRSLALIREAIAERTAQEAWRVIDVGGGASALVDHLVAEDRVEVCVVDIAAAALEHTRARLGDRAGRARLVAADITRPLEEIEAGWADIWHDRAVFHFLTTPEARGAYAANVARVLKPGGAAIIATFALDGPEKCSGLPVCRHDGASIVRELNAGGAAVRLLDEQREEHSTPWGSRQMFTYAVLERREPG